MTFIREADSLRALVCGIAHYPHAPKLASLRSPVADAKRAVDWLLGAGVSADRVRVHISARPREDQSLVDQLDKLVTRHPATSQELQASLSHLADGAEANKTKLMVFLFGHGIHLYDGGRVFLTEDYGDGGLLNNVSVSNLLSYLRNANCRSVHLFYGACANQAYSLIDRPNMAAEWKGVKPPQAPEWRAYSALYASQADQFARELTDDSRTSYFGRALFEALNRQVPVDAVREYDWHTGEELMPVLRLTQYVVTQVRQSSGTQVYAESNDQILGVKDGLCRWPVPTTTLTLEVEPDAGNAALEIIEIEQEKPYRSRIELAWPSKSVDLQVQTGAQLKITPIIKFGSHGLTATSESERLQVGQVPLKRPIRLRKAAEDDAEGGVTYEIQVANDLGQRLYKFDQKYGEIISRLPSTFSTGSGPGLRAADGTIVERKHLESGRIYRSGRFPATVKQQAGSWWRESQRVFKRQSPHLVVSLHKVAAPVYSELRLLKQSRRTEPVFPCLFPQHVKVSLLSQTAQEVWAATLNQMSASVAIRCLPGTYKVRVITPWGTAEDNFKMTSRAVTRVALPIPFERRPLRQYLSMTRAKAILKSADTVVRVEAGQQPLSLSVNGYAVKGIFQTAIAKHTLSLARVDRPLLLDAGSEQPELWRAEPLGLDPSPMWDILIGQGDLEDTRRIPTSDLVGVFDKSKDPLLATAATYALLYRANARDELLTATARLLELTDSLDAELLAAFAHGMAPSTRYNCVNAALKRQAIPYFRWGITLGIQMLTSQESRSLIRARRLWALISLTLCPQSVWTIWVQPEPTT